MGLLKNFYLLLLLLPLVGCSGGKKTANLEVSAAYMSTAPFGGGFMVVGENSSGKKFTVAVKGSNQTKIPLEAGTWTFTAVAWDGDSGDTPFLGTPYCGQLTGFNLTQDNATARIDINPTNCSSSPQIYAAMKFSTTFKVHGCDAFYSYNTSTDVFSPLSPEHTDNTCNTGTMIADFVTKFTYLRIDALQGVGNDLKPAFTSGCYDVNNSTGYIKIPMAKFPFRLRIFKTYDDCMTDRSSQNYTFPNGLEAGNPGSFDSIFSPTAQKILLATAPTKRGKSPFMREIPRILCGTSGSFEDCFNEPTPFSTHVKVPWFNNYWNDQILLKNVDASITTCPAGFFYSTNGLFFAEDCQIEDRTLKARVFRNQFMCADSPFLSSGSIMETQRRGDKIYIRKYDLGNDSVIVYNQNGKFLNEYSLGSNGLTRLSVSADGTKMVGLTSGDVYFYELNPTTQLMDLANARPLPGKIDVEMHSSGSYYYVTSGSVVSSYNWDSTTQINSLTFTDSVMDLKHHFGELFVLTSSTTSNVFRMPSAAGELPATEPASYSYMYLPTDLLEVAEDKFVAVNSGTSSYFWKDITNAVSVHGSFPTGFPLTSMSILNGNILFASGTTVDSVLIGTSSSSTQVDSCSDSVSVFAGTQSKLLQVESYAVSSGPAIVFDELFRMLGRRRMLNTDHPFYFFEALSHNDDISTGGELRRVQEMLGPQAIGAFFSEYPTCSDLWNALPVTGEISKPVTFKDETTGETMNLVIKTRRTNEFIGSFNCSATEGSCASERYGINIEFARGSGSEFEKTKIKLACGKQIGSFESYETEDGNTYRELFLYQTEFDTTSRFEKYSFDTGDDRRSDVMRFWKTSDDSGIFRRVETEINAPTKRASVTQLEFNNTNIFTSRYDIDSSIGTFSSTSGFLSHYGTNFEHIRDNQLMDAGNGMQEARACMGTNEVNYYASHVTGCNFTSFTPVPLSKNGLPLIPASFDIENPINLFSSGVFEITP